MQRIIVLVAVVFLSLTGLTALLAAAAPAAVFNVTTNGDALDSCAPNSNSCNLRAAIVEANRTTGAVTNLPGGALQSSLVAPAVVTITGPAGGLVNTSYVYTATVSPLSVTQPITFVWQVTGQQPVTHTVADISDTVIFQWSAAGSQLLNVSARSEAGFVQSSYGVEIGNPMPSLIAISPTRTLAGGPAFTLTVSGTNFVSGSIVRWNGLDRTTTFISANTLQAAIPAADTATPGTAAITVFNASPGGGESSPLGYAIWRVLYLPLVLR